MSEQKYNLRKTMFILVPRRTFEKDQVITHPLGKNTNKNP